MARIGQAVEKIRGFEVVSDARFKTRLRDDKFRLTIIQRAGQQQSERVDTKVKYYDARGNCGPQLL